MSRNLIAAVFGTVGLVVVAVPLVAHHSEAAEFDATKPVRVAGVVKKLEWTNPHIWFYVDVKDATGNLARVAAQRLSCGEDFCQISGNDDMALGFNAMGGVGCISVSANVAPKLCSDFQTATREGRWDDALELQDRLYPLHAALFTDASPGPTKYALSRVRAGFPTDLRLPLTEASDASKRAVDKALEHAGLI